MGSWLRWVVAALFLRLPLAAVVKPTARSVILQLGGGGEAVGQSFLKGKTALVTGGNAGIGLETVKALASAGCRVLLCSRSVSAAKEAVQSEITKEGLDGTYKASDSNIVVKQLDLEDLDSIRKLAEDVLATEQRLDLLINNAGIMSLPTLQRTAAGWEKQMAVNHFGHAVLTKRLLPLMLKSNAPGRVIALASTAHRFSSQKLLMDPVYSKPDTRYTPWGAYGDSKMANLLWAKGLAKDLEAQGNGRITAVSVHPGVVRTALWNQSPVNRLFSLFVGDRNVPEGAASTVWAAVAPRVATAEMRGAYISDCAPARPNDLACDPAMAERVWRVTLEELQRVGE